MRKNLIHDEQLAQRMKTESTGGVVLIETVMLISQGGRVHLELKVQDNTRHTEF